MCFDFDYVPEFHNSRIVKTRKEHQCDCCFKRIPVGIKVEYNAGKMEGDFYSYYVCDECKRKQLSIAAEEIRHGCSWNEAWCPLEEIHDYLCNAEVPMMEGTLDECLQQLNALWKETIEARRSALAS